MPPPPAPAVDPPFQPAPPPPPRTKICTVVTPPGTLKNCSSSDAENVTTTGDAANADELAAHKHTAATHISDPTDARPRLATLARPQTRIANTPGFTARAQPDSDHNRQPRTRPRADPPPDHPATPNTTITCLSVLIPAPPHPKVGHVTATACCQPGWSA